MTAATPDASDDDTPSLVDAVNALWPVARARMLAPKNLWRAFKLSRRFDLRFVRASGLKVRLPAYTIPDCDSCTDLCCTGPNAVVSLRLVDIARLLDHGLADAIDVPPRSLPVVESPTDARRRLERSLFVDTFPVLRRDATGTCTLLTEGRQCSAWPHWPLSCARYPFSVDVDNGVLFWASGCQSTRTVTIDDAPDSVRSLIDAAVDSYNERLRDIVRLSFALDEVRALGLDRYLRLERL